jgi:aspartyl protease family protein
MFKWVIGIVVAAVVLALAVPDLTPRLLALLEAPPTIEPPPAAAGSGSARVMLAADQRGHFETSLTVNGRPIKAMVDTGATVVALTYEDGRSLGLVRPGDRYEIKMQTANGTAGAKRVTLNTVRLGGISLANVDAIVAQEGALGVNLLGMSFLRKLRTFEMQNGRLVLEQ